MRVRLLIAVFLCLLAAAPARATAPAVAAASTPTVAEAGESVVSLYNRPVAVLRAPLFGVGPAERARRTERRIAELVGQGGPGQVTVQDEPLGSVFLIDGALAMLLTPDDADRVNRETLPAMTAAAELALNQAIAETREARDHGRLVRALAWAAGATAAFALATWAVLRFRGVLAARAARALAGHAGAVQVAGAPLIGTARLRQAARWTLGVLSWAVLVLLCYQWLVFVLTRFPYTRAWGERLGDFLFGVVRQVAGGAVHAVPDLIVAGFIFLVAKLIVDAVDPIFERAQRDASHVGWLDRDTAGPTRRIVQVGVWLFAVVMAYPYLPGADSDAFKGVSVLVGVMLTLGGSSLIGQGASGLILMYSRTVRVGEYVRINDQEGTVTELGAFTTRLRTGLGEEITLPNAVVLGTTTKNYSRAVRGAGYVVDTTVTIGYDTPWRQVHELLVAAARRTPGVLDDPAPVVFQTGLSDFYVEYRLVAQAVPERPRPRAELLSVLHANVLDTFHAADVQIMSPHYLADPAEPKIAPVRP